MGRDRRLILDITTMARWIGQPAGVVRREHALARHALAYRPDIRFCVLDSSIPAYRAVRPEWVATLADWNVALDRLTPAFRARRRGWRSALPSRVLLSMALEQRRLATENNFRRRMLDAAQRILFWPHGLPSALADRSGARLGAVAHDTALGELDRLGPDDTILSVGSLGAGKGEIIAGLKRRQGFRYVSMCHDLIAVKSPQFFEDEVARDVRRHWMEILPLAERILVNSRTVERDIRAFCRILGNPPGDVALVEPGCDLTGVAPAAALPAGLAAGRYALFVATIEPRKGHAMILDVWQRLLDKGLPQRRGFKLVLVGAPGWKMHDLLRRLAVPATFAGTVLHLAKADDAMLAALYRASAFCVLPSLDEGFGMPLIEAFACGKAVIASTGGSLPEVAGAFSPCLPPADSEAWFSLLERWIEDDGARAPYEARIREGFSPVSWEVAAAGIFAAAMKPGASLSPCGCNRLPGDSRPDR